MLRRLTCLPVVVGAFVLLAFAQAANASEPSVISEVWASAVASEDATLNAEIEDHSEEATYRFEYGPGDCASSACTSIPVPDGTVAASSGKVVVSRQLHYLTPGTVYHYRIVVNTAGGEQASGDQTFRPFSLSSGFKLPDGRAWELVSPVDKNDGGVASVVTRTRAATDGNSVAYVSLAGFGDVEGLGTTAEYESVRTGVPGTSGWATHSMMPKLEPVSHDSFFTHGRALYEGEFSSDLNNGVFRAYADLSGDPNLERVTNLYLRDDLNTPGPGDYRTLTACSVCASPLVFSEKPILVGASADFGHVVFEDWARLTADAPTETTGCVNEGKNCAPLLYEWDHGVVRYVGVLPSAEGGGPAVRSIGGRSQIDTANPALLPRSVSEDGSRVLFTVPKASIPFTPAGPLYMRIDHSSTVRISASENSGAPDPKASAVFQAASSDLSKVFFTSTSQLTETPGSGLYEYDAAKPEGHHLTLVGSSPKGVLGASADGAYLYFTSHEKLLSNQNAFPREAGSGIYLWHAGTLSLVGSVTESDAGLNDVVGLSLDGGEARVTPDGKHLLFVSHSGNGLTGYDQRRPQPTCNNGDNCAELYLYDAESQSVKCVSCSPTGAVPTAQASFVMSTSTGGVGDVPHANHPMSDDGRYVFFTSAERLVPEDHNSVQDVYEYDSQTEQLHLLSSGTGDQPSYFMEASPNGHDVFFTTVDRLVGWDIDEANDLYDARVGGGLPEPAHPVECEGDACSTPFAAPLDMTPSSATFSGPGNQEPQAETTGSAKKKAKPKPKKKKRKGKRAKAKRARHGHAGRTHR